MEKLRGDRSADLSALEGREWDAVLDVAAYMPDDVRRAVEALRGNVGRYVFVSSISVYADQSVPPVEGAAVAELQPGQETDEDPELYGARKAACERIVEEAFGDAALVVRPGLIVGPHDPTGRFTYWPHRVARGGEVLAPGARPTTSCSSSTSAISRPGWCRRPRMASGGTFNATGEPMPFGDLLEECRAVAGSDAAFTWVDSERLLAAEVGPWMEAAALAAARRVRRHPAGIGRAGARGGSDVPAARRHHPRHARSGPGRRRRRLDSPSASASCSDLS